MPRVLNVDEMLELVLTLDSDLGAQAQTELEALGTRLAVYIASKLGVGYTESTFEGTAFAGTCSAFTPLNEGDPIPTELDFYDQGGDWE